MTIKNSRKLLKIAMCCGMIGEAFCTTQHMDWESIWKINDEIENVVYTNIPKTNISDPTFKDVKNLYSRAKKVLAYYKNGADKQTAYYVNELKELFPSLKKEYKSLKEEHKRIKNNDM